MNEHRAIGEWRERLEGLLQRLARKRSECNTASAFQRVIVVDEVGSTQDLARQRGPVPGEIVTAMRQTAGRGRLNRSWADTGHAGVALSMITTARAAEQLVTRSAVAVATALETLDAAHTLGAFRIKWPNDVVAQDGGKVAGILVECVTGAAIIGVGINVAQRDFVGDLALKARSLAQLGIEADRLEVIERAVEHADRWLAAPDDEVLAAYRLRDALRGTCARFKVADRFVEGKVLEVDPTRGIRIATESGEQMLPAAFTTLAVATGADTPT